MKKKISLLTALLLVLCIIPAYALNENPSVVPVKVLYDYVLDAGTVTDPDFETACRIFSEQTDGWGGHCSAVAKVLESGDTVVARNMDYNISNAPVILVRTEAEGLHKTLGLSYNSVSGPSYQQIIEQGGIPADYAAWFCYLCEDVMNDAGLYVEMNMRCAECFEEPEMQFENSGTNPESDTRVTLMMLPQMIGQHCADIDEIIPYMQKLDIYSPTKGGGDSNIALLIAQPDGRYGVMEFARNRIFWNEGQHIQTNFYLSDEIAKDQTKMMGKGRYDVLDAGYDSVSDEAELSALIDRVSYFQMYRPDCTFDARTEFVGDFPEMTYETITAAENEKGMRDYIAGQYAEISNKSRQELQDMNEIWETTYNVIANCTQKTMKIRFFENLELTVTVRAAE